MKLILERWNRFLAEAEINKAKRLSIFDFDETLAFAKGYIDVLDRETGKKVKRITTQEEYDELKVMDKYDFDFSALNKISDPQEVKSIMATLRDRIKQPNTQVFVLTARAGDVEDDIHRYLATLEPPVDTSDLYVKGLAGANKGQYVLELLKEFPNIKQVEFYDDSMENIKAMVAASQQNTAVEFKIYLVKDGTVKQVK
jgi:hypothetical protein